MSSSTAEQELGQNRTKKKPNGTGRKKIEMKKIANNSSRKVAFSKRRKGLFKKGIELCRLCDAMIAIIVLSPKGKVYSNGYPSVDDVINLFQSEEDEERQLEEDQSQYNVGDASGSISLSHEETEEGGEEEEEEEQYWWEEDIEGLELEELESKRAGMEELRCNMASFLEEMMRRRLHERDLLGSERVLH